MKRTFAPLVLMMIFSLGLALTSVCQSKTAEAKVAETAVFDYDLNRYLSSKNGEVDNHYTEAVITKKNNLMTFKMKVGKDSVHTAVYKIVERKQGHRVILAKRVDTKAKIKIIQRKHELEVLCDFNRKHNRFDGAIIFTDLEFK